MKNLILLILICLSCSFKDGNFKKTEIIYSIVQTEKVERDIDDPAIWYNESNPSESLIFGTQKDVDGAIIVYDLNGKIDKERSIFNISRPNNVDVIKGVRMGDIITDILVATERFKNTVRIFSLPEMLELDGGGLRVFKDEENPEPMGVALWKDKQGFANAIVGKKDGISGEYVSQYKLVYNKNKFELEYLRTFGLFSGKKEIEAISVDNINDIIYYSDEGFGVRAYHADPEDGDDEILNFAKNFTGDQEGISIINKDNNYVVVSDQQKVNQFRIFSPELDYKQTGSFYVNCIDSDGSEFHPGPFPEPFENGIFVAMSDDLSFHYYSWDQIKEYFDE